jgi:hypothetical protein
MRRFLCPLIVLVLAGAPSSWQPLRGQAPTGRENQTVGKPPQGRDNSQNSGGSDQRGSKERPFVVDTKGHQDSPGETAETNAEKEHQRYVEGRTLYFAAIAAWATVALCIIGIGGTFAALLTLNAIRRQVALQELTLEQWVDYGNFKSEYRANDSGRQLMVISLELLNPSNFPVVLPDASLLFEMGNTKITSKPGVSICRLLPNKPHRISVGFELSADQAEVYAHGSGLVVRVSGNLAHIGTLKERHEQPISGKLMCHERFTVFEEETTRQDSNQGQSPN